MNIHQEIKREEDIAEEISKTLDKFGSGPPYYEFQTRASRRRDNNMVDPLSAKLGEFDVNDPANINGNIERQDESNNENIYLPAVSKEILECEWLTLFGSKDYQNVLRTLAFTGRLRDCCRFRGVCWRIFLGCLPDDPSQWLETIRKSRNKYNSVKSKFLVDPYSSLSDRENVQVFNPLSQDSDSPWSQYFEDQKLNDLIIQDLDRLFPGMHYFQSKKIKDILLHILFCYARMNPSVGYKQGMHEVLAPLVFVLEYDSEVFQFLENSDNEVMKNLIDPAFLECDAFSLFEHLMDIIEPWYAQAELPAVPPKQTFDPSGVPFTETQPISPPTAIIRKLTKIQESMLKKYDTVLYNHLRDMQIEPQLYGLRWVRLLYGREFTTMEDILTLWDGLFADGISLDLVDYVYLSLICNKRRKLLSADHFGCLTILMKTPYCRRDAKAVVLEAKYMRDIKLDPTKKSPPRHEPKSVSTIVFPSQEALQSKITSGLQMVLRGARQVPSRKGSEPNSRNTMQQKKSEKTKERAGEERKRPVELKTNNKSAPSSHMFPHDSDDEDLFMTSPRSRTSSATFLSKLSSKVRQTTKTDLTTLQQDHERLQEQVSHFKAELDKLQSISIYCGTKMDSYINLLQEQITNDKKCMDVVYLSIAGLKQVRDILKGTLTFQRSTMEQDTEFSHIDSAISSLKPNTSSSTANELPGSLPVPLLADFGHFERQNDEYYLVESNDESTHNTNSTDNISRDTCSKDSDNGATDKSVEEGGKETVKEEINEQLHTENTDTT